MTINVYWTCIEDEWQLAQEPESIAKSFYKLNLFESDNNEMQVNQCPAFKDSINNVFGLKSLYRYEFFLDENNNVRSNMIDQEFFDKHVHIRSVDKKCFSFNQKFIFFTDADSLEMTGNEFPFFENNNVTQRCLIFPGKFDIAKRFRPVEFAFCLKDPFDTFRIDYEEIYSYIRFHTDEKIKFRQFRMTNELTDLGRDCTNMNKSLRLKTLSKFYKHFKIKKFILNEIKKNLI